MTTRRCCLGGVLIVVMLCAGSARAANESSARVGATGPRGCRDNPKKTNRLRIEKPGVYENYLIDGGWRTGNTVKVTADNVTIRNCEIRNTGGNAIGVFSKNVVIENCKIHHALAGSFKTQKDAHGITGQWNNVTIRNCEIFYVSGDCIQFDPDRSSAGRVLIEQCTLWTGPLPDDAAGFRKGERPGENAFDSKTPAKPPRCQLLVRNCLFRGWNQPGQISLMAALNVKENVDATIERCLFRDNQVCFRLRGPTRRGAARVTIIDCALFDASVGVRMEDDLQNLKIVRLGVGSKVKRPIHRVGKGRFAGFSNTGMYRATSYEQVLKNGLRPGSP